MEPISAAIMAGGALIGGLLGNRNQPRASAEERAAAAAQAEAARSQGRLITYLTDLAQSDLIPRDYTRYGGERVADFSTDQRRAFEFTRAITDNISNNAGGWLGSTAARANEANTLAQRGADLTRGPLGGTFYEAPIDRYMNPYLEGVLEPARRDLERSFERRQNDLNATAARTGSFGGSRNAVAQSQLERNMLETRADLESEARFRAFEDAANRFREDQRVLPSMISEAQRQQLAGQGATANNLGLSGNLISVVAPALLTTGGMQQDLDQRRLDVDYSNFLEERDWGRNEALTRIGALQGIAGINRGQQVQQPPNATMQGVGAGLGIGSQLANSGLGSWLGRQWSLWMGSPGTNTPAGMAANNGFTSNLAAAASGSGSFVDPTFGGASY